MTLARKRFLALMVAVVVGGAAPRLLAECFGDSRFIGNLDGDSTIQWNLNDPNADFAYFFVENPLVNEGALGDPANFRRHFLNLQEFGSTIDEAFSSGLDIAELGSGTNGCPATGHRLVALFSDLRGTTCVSVVDDGYVQWNFGDAAGGSDLVSPITGGPVLERSTMEVRILSAVTNPDGSMSVAVGWQPPFCNTDAPISLEISSYDIWKLVLPQSQTPESGLAALEKILTVPAYPLLATPTGPGRGRGKGLERAPGQNR